MTLKVRRSLLDILLVFALAGGAFAVYSWIYWFPVGGEAFTVFPLVTMSWWTSLRPAVDTDIIWSMGAISFLVFFPLINEMFMRRLFGRSPSPEIFFLRFFLLTLPLQSVRLVMLFVLSETVDGSWAVTATRIAWFARVLGIISLLNVGLYSTEIPFRRSSAILGMGALASLAVAVMLPLDVTQITGGLIVRGGTATALALVCIAMELLAVVSLTGSAYVQKNGRYYLLAAALLLTVAGTDMVFFTSRPLAVPGAAMLLGGAMLFSREIRKIYQWI